MSKLRILLVEDHAVVRDGLKCLLNAEPDLEVVAEAGDARQALLRAAETQPEVVIMDVALGDASGTSTTRELKDRWPDMKILAVTVHEDITSISQMLEAGATGYLVKRAAGEELIAAVHKIAASGVYFDPRIASKLIHVIGPRHLTVAKVNRDLSERETQVMRLVAEGFTNKEIAARLDISVKTVETHKARSMAKLGLRRRVDIVRLAADRGWLGSS